MRNDEILYSLNYLMRAAKNEIAEDNWNDFIERNNYDNSTITDSNLDYILKAFYASWMTYVNKFGLVFNADETEPEYDINNRRLAKAMITAAAYMKIKKAYDLVLHAWKHGSMADTVKTFCEVYEKYASKGFQLGKDTIVGKIK